MTPASGAAELAAELAGGRWRRSGPLLFPAGVCVVAGGLAAAVTGPTQWSHGSWVAAFLVLVAGVAQAGIGAGQAHLAATTPPARFVAAQAAMWNAGCALVIAGTLLSGPAVVAVGSAPLVVVLVMAVSALRGGAQGGRSSLLVVYRLLLVVVLASIPVGIALSVARH